MKQLFLAEKTTDKSENRTNKNKRQVNGTIKKGNRVQPGEVHCHTKLNKSPRKWRCVARQLTGSKFSHKYRVDNCMKISFLAIVVPLCETVSSIRRSNFISKGEYLLQK